MCRPLRSPDAGHWGNVLLKLAHVVTGHILARGSSLEGSIHIAKLRTHRALSGK